MRILLTFLFLLSSFLSEAQTRLTIVELNTENLFDTRHDTLKNDYEFLPDSPRHWTRTKYWQKLNRIGQTIIACGEDSSGWTLPDIVGLCEVENDSVLFDLTRRSLLHKARYEYVMTVSNDARGIDVALLYSPFSFRLIKADTIRVIPMKEMRPTRDILYVEGEIESGDTLHVFLLHAPSRMGGELYSRPFRKHVMEQLCNVIDSLRRQYVEPKLLVMGDFNDYADSPSLQLAYEHGLINVSAEAHGCNGAKGTYRYHGEWGSLDQILVSENLRSWVIDCRINDARFLLEEDTKYGGVKPRRNYNGMRFNNGFSDHLPLVLRLQH
ncbi:endonuclease/exonuclease/phosphatase family protein [Prevotella melaninogenica]|uniref:Endonuclease n=1 Tax=Prevotella melaninogenica TaxID=28132 RepID=A0A250KG74_9BACT|nr:endonuclease/exonuclease/phosphatase family protein [Prevotella melaninogenica]BBA28659.1 endonuclease [Prevotella melaninogenica]